MKFQDQEKGLLVQSKHRFYLDIAPEAVEPTEGRLANGFSSFAVTKNENIDQTAYLGDDAFGSTTVMGAQLTISFDGHRYFEDPVQDWLFSISMEVGVARETTH